MIWAPQTPQILIASKSIFNKHQRGAKLLMEHSISQPGKFLKMLSKKPKSCSQPRKNIPGKQTQTNVLNQSEKRVKINDSVINIKNLEVDGLEVVQNLTTALRLKLDESQDLI